MMVRAGLDVCALARGRTLEAVRRNGLQLIEPGPNGEERSQYQLEVSDDPRALGSVDLIVL